MAITLKAARVNAGFTQKEAAEKLQINKNTLANYENYRSTPNIEMAQNIAELYGCSVNNLIFFKQ